MSEWPFFDQDFANTAYDAYPFPYYQEKDDQNAPAQCLSAQEDPYPCHSPSLTVLLSPAQHQPQACACNPAPKGENPRELRNKAEKQRRDKMNESISRLAAIVPPVAKVGKKMNKRNILRYAAHFLRAHQHVFGNSIDRGPEFSASGTQTLLKTLRGFLITTTYKGIIVVVSPNIQEYLGYTEVELLGQNIFSIIHKEDHRLLLDQLIPRSCSLSSTGQLVIPKEKDAEQKIAEDLMNEKRSFIVRFRKLNNQRTEPAQYVTCHIEGSLRMSDRAGTVSQPTIHIGRRARSRGDNPFASGNDIVFIGMARPIAESFLSESGIESFRMEYRTRHSIDGEIIQCEQRIALVTGYMIHEVSGVNAMNFIHRDDVRWVIIALREMYDKHRLVGESCYRLMTKNGQFIYMRTLGYLDVDSVTKAVTSFVCTNTVVAEKEGKQLIKLMKRKFTLMINNEELKDDEEEQEEPEDAKQSLPLEDPEQLEKVILHLVTNLPSPHSEDSESSLKDGENHLAIIPPHPSKIKGAIEKSYNVIKEIDMASKNKTKKKPTKSASSTRRTPYVQPRASTSTSQQNQVITTQPRTRNQRRERTNTQPIPSTSGYHSNQLTANTSRQRTTYNPIRQDGLPPFPPAYDQQHTDEPSTNLINTPTTSNSNELTFFDGLEAVPHLSLFDLGLELNYDQTEGPTQLLENSPFPITRENNLSITNYFTVTCAQGLDQTAVTRSLSTYSDFNAQSLAIDNTVHASTSVASTTQSYDFLELAIMPPVTEEPIQLLEYPPLPITRENNISISNYFTITCAQGRDRSPVSESLSTHYDFKSHLLGTNYTEPATTSVAPTTYLHDFIQPATMTSGTQLPINNSDSYAQPSTSTNIIGAPIVHSSSSSAPSGANPIIEANPQPNELVGNPNPCDNPEPSTSEQNGETNEINLTEESETSDKLFKIEDFDGMDSMLDAGLIDSVQMFKDRTPLSILLRDVSYFNSMLEKMDVGENEDNSTENETPNNTPDYNQPSCSRAHTLDQTAEPQTVMNYKNFKANNLQNAGNKRNRRDDDSDDDDTDDDVYEFKDDSQ